MKRQPNNQAIETHDISQKKFPMPGTDLGTTNAIPYDGAYDVDMSGGKQSEYCLGHGDSYSCFSRTVQGSEDDLKPAKNPTRYRPPQPEMNFGGVMAVSMRRKRK